MSSVPQGAAQTPGAAPVLRAERSSEGGGAELDGGTAGPGSAEPSEPERPGRGTGQRAAPRSCPPSGGRAGPGRL